MKGPRLRMIPIAAAFVLAASALASPLGSTAVRAGDFSISGRVVGSAGDLGGIAVSGCTTDWSYCSDIVFTDEAGAFTLGGLKAGAYILDVQAGPTYLWGFYQAPGLTLDFSAATPVDVSGGSVILPDIQLTVALSISGMVTGSAGMLGDLMVVACGIGQGFCSFGSFDESGSYIVPGLGPDTYRLTFANGGMTPYVSGLYSGSGLTHQFSDEEQVVLTDSSVVLPTFEMPLGVTITGSVSGAVGQLDEVSVMASEDTFDAAAFGETFVDSEGNFTLMGLWPGSYRIQFEDWSRTYVSGTWTPDGLIQSDEPHTTVGPDGLDLGVVQLEVASSISGTVQGESGTPDWIQVTACREDGMCWQAMYDSGSFSILGLPPGSYLVQFSDWSGTYAGGYYSESGIVPSASEATPLTVPPSVSGLAVTLQPAGPAGVPGAPTNVYAIAGDGAAEVFWDPPLNDGGSPILEYYVTTPDGMGCTTSDTHCTAYNLTYGETYAFTVAALNAAGLGQPSAPSDPVTIPVVPPPPAAVRLGVVVDPQTIVAGGAATVTVSALDQDGNVVPDYVGTVGISASDPWSGLPAPYTFTPEDAGVHQFTVYLGTAGPQLVTAADGVLEQGEAVVTVTPGPATRYVVGGPQTTTAGARQQYSITATDGFGNVVTDYSGTAGVRSTDPKLAAPASVEFVGGHATLKATFKTAGLQCLGLSDSLTGAVGEVFVQVEPAAAARLTIGGAPRGAEVGDPVTVTVTALDRFGNVATGYTGTVHFSSKDRAAVLPADHTFTAQDAGTHAFTFTLNSRGQQWVKVRDTGKLRLGAIVRIRVVRDAGLRH
jgi:hypothetical protein